MTLTAEETWETGFVRDTEGRLVVVSEAEIERMETGFLRDGDGRLVVTGPGSAPVGGATIVEAKPKTLAAGSTVFYKNPETAKIELEYVGNSKGEAVIVSEFTGIPADGSVTAAKVAAANIDGAAATPSMRSLDTDSTLTANSDTKVASQKATKGYVDSKGSKLVLASDVGPITSQPALQNVTGLGVEIGASATEMWLLKYWLLVNAANATMDVKFGFTVPTSATMQWGVVEGNTSVALASWGGTITSNTPTALATQSETLSLGTRIGTTGISLIAIVFGGGTGGTVQLQYCQATSDGGALKIAKGSIAEAARVAS